MQEGGAMSPLDESGASAPRRIVPFPQDEPPLPAARQSWLYTAILGNGRVLACLDASAALAQLFYPYLDAGPHLHTFLLGLHILPDSASGQAQEESSVVSWLADPAWTHTPGYVEHAAVVRCVSTHASLPIQLEQHLAVHHDSDVLFNDMRLTNRADEPLTLRVVIYADCDIHARQRGTTCYVDRDTSSLLFFADDCYIAAHCDHAVYGWGCARREAGNQERVFHDASSGRFNGQIYATGQVRGSICYHIGQIAPGQSLSCQVRLCFGRSLDEIHARIEHPAQSRPQVEVITGWWQQQYLREVAFIHRTDLRAIARRCLLTLRLLTDASTGGILAAPECDPDFTGCGGYGYCWPRDGALIGHALDVFGCFEHARAFYDWALGAQEASGVWYQRYSMRGTLAPTWGLVQFDETGAVVWAICRHIELSGDLAYGHRIWPQLLQACTYLQSALDPETGLAPPTIDLWEEREGISTYACACTWAAFDACAWLARALGLEAEAEAWSSAATLLKEAIERHLWDPSLQRFIRGLKSGVLSAVGLDDQRPGPREQDPPAVITRDTTIDASLLGLSVPFAVFPADDPRMLATAEAIEQHLTSPVGGICRYQGDTYQGGNPWIICTLWLAMQWLQCGYTARGRLSYDWALAHRTTLDLFGEQINRVSGQPCWVTPLSWSHAMFLLATRAAAQCGLLEPEEDQR